MFYSLNLKTTWFGEQTYALSTDSTCTAELTSFVSHGKKLIMNIEQQYYVKL